MCVAFQFLDVSLFCSEILSVYAGKYVYIHDIKARGVNPVTVLQRKGALMTPPNVIL